MLTRRNVLKRFVSTVAAGGMALVGLRPAKASPVFRPAKSSKVVEGMVTLISYHSYPDLRDFEFGTHKACMTADHAVTIIRGGHRAIRPVKDVRLGDIICLPKYLTREVPMVASNRIKEQKC